MFASGSPLTESQEKESVNASFQFQYVQYQIQMKCIIESYKADIYNTKIQK